MIRLDTAEEQVRELENTSARIIKTEILTKKTNKETKPKQNIPISAVEYTRIGIPPKKVKGTHRRNV